MRIRIATPPAVEPVSVDEVKLYARIDHSTEDAIVTGWIKTARAEVENYLRRSVVTQTVELFFDDFPLMPLNLPRAPVQSVSSIKYYDTANTETSIVLTNFLIDTDHSPARIDLAYGVSWPATTLRSMNAFKITYVAGYGVAASVPQFIKDAIFLYCSYRNENRVGESAVPKAFYDLLAPEKIWLSLDYGQAE